MDLYRWDSNITVYLKSIGTDKAVPLLLELKWPFYFFHFAIIDFEWIRSDVYVRPHFVLVRPNRHYRTEKLNKNFRTKNFGRRIFGPRIFGWSADRIGREPMKQILWRTNAVRGYLVDILSENSSLSWISKFPVTVRRVLLRISEVRSLWCQ